MKSEWQKLVLADIINIIGGGTPKRAIPEYWNGNIPWLSVVDFNTDNRHVFETKESITELGLQKSSTKLLEAGQIIISARGTVGALAQLYKPMAFNQSCYGLDGKQELITNDFLYYLVKEKIKDLQQITHGGVFDTITKDTFKQIEIILPPLPTQKKIAHILSTLDDKIELNRKMNQTLEEMASAIFKSWFVDFDPVHARLTCKDEAELENIAKELGISKAILDLFPGEFEESEFGMIPKGWGVKEFISLVKQLKPGTNYQPDRVENGIPFVNGKHIQDGFLDLTDIKYITEDEYKRVHKIWQPEAYDVLITRIGTLGKVGVILESDLPLALHYNSIDIKADKLSHQLLYFLLKSDFFQKQFHKYKKHAVQEFITIEAVEQLKIILPSCNDSLSEFDKYFKNLFDTIENNMVQIKTLQKTRDTLLPKLLSGEIDVSGLCIGTADNE